MGMVARLGGIVERSAVRGVGNGKFWDMILFDGMGRGG